MGDFVDPALLVVGDPLAYRFAGVEVSGALNGAIQAVPLPVTDWLAVFDFALDHRVLPFAWYLMV